MSIQRDLDKLQMLLNAVQSFAEQMFAIKEQAQCVKWIIATVLLIAATSCAEHEKKKTELGQYVYVDPFCKVHVDRDCAAQSNENKKTKDERMLASRGVEFLDTCSLSRYGYDGYGYTLRLRFCPKCVDDDTYRHLLQITERNEASKSDQS